MNYEVIDKIYSGETPYEGEEDSFADVVKDKDTNKLYLKKGEEMVEISFYQDLYVYENFDYGDEMRTMWLFYIDSEYKMIQIGAEGDSLHELLTSPNCEYECDNGVKVVVSDYDNYYFLKPDGTGSLNKYGFDYFEGIRGDFACVGNTVAGFDTRYGPFYLGEEPPLYEKRDEASKKGFDRSFVSSENFVGNDIPFLIMYDKDENFCAKRDKEYSGENKVYIDVLGNCTAEETQLGEDMYQYKKGEISLYDLNHEHFKDPKVLDFVRRQEKLNFASMLANAPSVEELKKVREEMLTTEDYLYSILDEQYEAM